MITNESILQQFPQVFKEQVGQLEGEYLIKIDTVVDSVKHSPRREPVALRKPMKTELKKTETQNIMTPVTTQTFSVSCMTTPKPDGGEAHMFRYKRHKQSHPTESLSSNGN